MSFPVTGRGSLEMMYAAPTSTPTATVGESMEDEFGGRWRYCVAGGAISNPLLLAGTYAQPTDLTPGATAVGSHTIACTGSGDASCTKDQYAGGSIIIGAAAANRRFYMIRSNTASATTTTTLTLASPVIYAIAGTEWATIGPSPYRNVRVMAGNYMAAVCAPLQPVASGYYFWGKTRGACFGTVHSTVPGAAGNDRALIVSAAGALMLADESYNAGTSHQMVGYLIPRTMGTYAGGDQSFMLQLE